MSSLKQLLSALHCGVVTVLASPDKETPSEQQLQYQVKGSQGVIIVWCVYTVSLEISNFPLLNLLMV